MAIDTNNNINSSSTATTRGKSSSAAVSTGKKDQAPSSAVEAKTSKDNVVLSEGAQRLNRLEANIASLPDVDSERVAAIKDAIASGRFEINAQRIAENMLNQDDLLS